MHKNSKSKRTKQSDSAVITILLRFAVVALINLVSVLVLCLYFYLADKNVYEEYIVILIGLSAADFVSSYFIGKKIRKNGMLYGVLYNLPFIVLFIVISLLLNGFSFDSRLLYFIVSKIILSAIGGITAVNSKSKRK